MRVCEFDMGAAGVHTAMAHGMITSEEFSRFMSLAKPARVVSFGCWQRDNKTGKIVRQYMGEVLDRFIETHGFSENHIIEKTPDSVFINWKGLTTRPDICEFHDIETGHIFPMNYRLFSEWFHLKVPGSPRIAHIAIPDIPEALPVVRHLSGEAAGNRIFLEGIGKIIRKLRQLVPGCQKMNSVIAERYLLNICRDFITHNPFMDMPLCAHGAEVKEYDLENYQILKQLALTLLDENRGGI